MTDISERETLLRIDRMIAESEKLRAERDELFAEQAKLYAEAFKLKRDPWISGLASAAAMGAVVATLIFNFSR
jgi:hypothetical protein